MHFYLNKHYIYFVLIDYRPNIFFGCTVGRVANRISKAQFKLNDFTYNLDKNNGEHCLHGGFQGLSQKNWEYSLIKNGVKFTCFSPDNDCGFPGSCFNFFIIFIRSK